MSNKVVSTTLVARGVGTYQAKMAQAASANSRFGASAAVPAARVGTMQSSMKGLAASAGLINPALLGAGGAVLAIKSVVGAAVEWESAFAGVQKTVDGTEDELAAISDGLRDMSTEIPVTSRELAGIAETAGQLGIQTASIEEFTRVMADLGVATNMSSEQAATGLARIANITQMSQSDFDRLGSTVVDLGNNLATTESEIVDMSLRLAGAGNQAGLTESEILGLSGALSSVGIRAEAGGTAFSKVMIEITNAAMSGGEELEQFADIAGVTADEFARMFEEDPAEAVIRFVEGLGGAADAGDNLFAILEDLGIEEQRMRDALLRTAGAGDVLRDSVERGNSAWEENIALTEEAEQRYGTTASQWQIFTNQVKEAATEIGEVVLPAVNAALEDINNTLSEGVPGGQGGMLDSLRDVLTAPLNLDMLRVWVNLFKDGTTSGRDLRAALEQPFGLEEHEEEFLRLNGQMGQSPALAAEAADGIEDVEESLDGAGEAASTATEQLQGYMDKLRAATDPVFALNQAVQRVDEAQDNYNDAVSEYGPASDEAKQAAFDLAAAVADLEQKAIDGDLSFGEFERELDRWVAMGKITADEADAIRGRVEDLTAASEDYDGQYQANMIAHTETAEQRLARVNALIASIPSRISTSLFLDSSSYNTSVARVARTGVMEAVHTGGYIHPSGDIQRFHAGGMVGGLARDEVPAVLQTGEMVLSRADVSQLRAAITSERGGLTVQQTFNGDVSRTTLAEARHQQRLAFLEAV